MFCRNQTIVNNPPPEISIPNYLCRAVYRLRIALDRQFCLRCSLSPIGHVNEYPFETVVKPRKVVETEVGMKWSPSVNISRLKLIRLLNELAGHILVLSAGISISKRGCLPVNAASQQVQSFHIVLPAQQQRVFRIY